MFVIVNVECRFPFNISGVLINCNSCSSNIRSSSIASSAPPVKVRISVVMLVGKLVKVLQGSIGGSTNINTSNIF